jgi:hypothetical protein
MALSIISVNSLPKKMLAIGSPRILGWQSARPRQVLPISGRREGIGGDSQRLSGLTPPSITTKAAFQQNTDKLANPNNG